MYSREEVKKLIDSVMENNPTGFLDLVQREILENVYDEEGFVEAFYEDPSTYNPKKGLEADLIDPELLRDLVLEKIMEREEVEHNGINQSYEETKDLLSSGLLSDQEVDEMAAKANLVAHELQQQNITFNSVQTLEKFLGTYFALATKGACCE